ncbi:hypothetical protein F442_22375 [Phytophthora nicotianae P10297]|uniref:Uncharacterized protein n=1 Tax=Phytophthora nicotianae P10297 TaxID=1317064 RepID=W2Y0R7_PHYNI|nr:hypothetical protein F442_22375 [Phytophthora nicotianae P10297]
MAKADPSEAAYQEACNLKWTLRRASARQYASPPRESP